MTRVGLVLGAGGPVGRGYHSGTLAALSEVTGWDPRDADVVVGTSAGSSVGALLRAGIPAADLAAHAQGEPVSAEIRERFPHLEPPPPEPALPRPSRRHLFLPAAPGLLAAAALAPWRFHPGVLAGAALPPGECPTTPIGNVVRSAFRGHWPERDLWICAVRLDRGRRRVFGMGGAPEIDLATAVEASSAAPTYFAPVGIDGVRYVDGSTWSPTNLDLVAGLGLDLVVVIAPLSAEPRARLGSARGLLRLVPSLMLDREEARVRAAGTEVARFEPTAADLAAMGPNPMDSSRRPRASRTARATARRRLEDPQLRHLPTLLSRGPAARAPA